ncbi:MAG: cache domain-containing protein [Desulfohalobiaceae bacterium]
MIVSCQHCGKKLKVDFSMIQGNRVKVRCKHCRQLFTVSRPTGGEESAAEEDSKGEEVQEPGGRESEEGMRIEGWSLKSKLTAIIVLLMVGALSATGLIVSYFSRATLTGQTETHLRRIVTEKSSQYSAIFDRISDEAKGVADYVSRLYDRGTVGKELGFPVLLPWDGNSYGNPVSRQRYGVERLLMQRVGETLQSLATENQFLSLAYYGSANDLLVLHEESALQNIRELEGFVPTQRPWYTKAAEQRTVIWSDPYVDANSKNLVVTCAAPVQGGNGELHGVVGFDVLLQTIERDMLNLDLEYADYAFLVNHEGEALVQPGMVAEGLSWDERYSTDNLRETENPEFNSIVEDMVQGRTGFETFSREGGEKFIAYAYLPTIQASLAIVSSRAEVMDPVKRIRTNVLALWAVVLLITIWISLYVGRWITRPINDLTRMANQISQGKTNLEELPEERKDEIGLLTRSFNRLVASLRVALSKRR